MNNRHIGSLFDDFLIKEEMYEDVKSEALASVLLWLQEEMDHQKLSKSEMAKRMGTSRSQLDRLLQGEMEDIRFGTFFKAAHALGKDVKITLVPAES